MFHPHLVRIIQSYPAFRRGMYPLLPPYAAAGLRRPQGKPPAAASAASPPAPAAPERPAGAPLAPSHRFIPPHFSTPLYHTVSPLGTVLPPNLLSGNNSLLRQPALPARRQQQAQQVSLLHGFFSLLVRRVQAAALAIMLHADGLIGKPQFLRLCVNLRFSAGFHARNFCDSRQLLRFGRTGVDNAAFFR